MIQAFKSQLIRNFSLDSNSGFLYGGFVYFRVNEIYKMLYFTMFGKYEHYVR